MRCAKCGHKIRGATWYCPSCGTPVDDLNVADSVYPAGGSRLWVRILAAAAALFALAGIVYLTGGLLRRVDVARRTAAPTATAALPAVRPDETSSGPVETLVAAGERSANRYPDGAVDAPPDVATAVAPVAMTAGPAVAGAPVAGVGDASAGGIGRV